jgi:glutathione S-transferase
VGIQNINQNTICKNKNFKMPITIVGLATSTCGRRALMALEETGTPYTLQPVNFSIGEHKTAEYKAKHQPFGKIPALHEDDFHIYESRAITKYIADKYDKTGKLNPSDPKKRAVVEQWISVETSYYNSAEKIVGELVFKPMFGVLADETVIAAEDVRLQEVLAVLNKRLGEAKYLAGEDFTVADLVYMPYTAYLLGTTSYASAFDKYENVARWWNDISSRPAWQRVLALK